MKEIGILVGLLLWGITLFLFGVVGHITFLDLLIFFLQFIAIIVPSAIRCLANEDGGLSAIWLTALAPIPCFAIGFLSHFFLSSIFEKKMNITFSDNEWIVVNALVYVPIAFFSYRGLSRSGTEKADETPQEIPPGD